MALPALPACDCVHTDANVNMGLVSLCSFCFFAQSEQLFMSCCGNLQLPLDTDTLRQLIPSACPKRRRGEDGLCDVDG